MGDQVTSATGNSSFRVQFLAEENLKMKFVLYEISYDILTKISTPPTNLQFDYINTLLSLENETPTLKFQFPGLVWYIYTYMS